MSRALLLASVAAVLTVAPAVQAQNVCWGSIAADTTVDEADVTKVQFSGSSALITPGLTLPQTAVLRYNVVAVEGALSGPVLFLKVNYVDTGAGGRIVARLKEQELFTGTTVTLLTLDTNAFPVTPSSGTTNFVESLPVVCGTGPVLTDFNNKLYYVEVTMTQSGASSLRLKGLQVCTGSSSSC